MSSVGVWLLALSLCWGFPSSHNTLSYAAVYYVTPHTPNPDCPTSGESCLTLNEYAQRDHFDEDDNISLLFLNGEHNLTAQNFEVYHKTSLNMAPFGRLDRVVIQLFQTGIIVQNINEVKLFELELVSQTTDLADYTLDCLSVSNSGLLTVTKLSLHSCQFSLHGKISAAITELTASKSCIHTCSTVSNQTVAISNSKLYFSTLNISDSSPSHTIIGVIIVNELNIESCLLYNSLVTLKSQMTNLTTFVLSVLSCSISSYNCCNSETGIKIESYNMATIRALVEDSSIVGNYQGINLVVEGESHVELTVNYCSIENNSYVSDSKGGIAVFQSNESNAVTMTTITSTTLSGNNHSQISIVGYSGRATVTVFNCTIRNTSHYSSYHGAGAYLANDNGYGCSNVVLNVTQSLVENNVNGMMFEGNLHSLHNVTGYEIHCTYKFFFISNTVINNNMYRYFYPLRGGLTIASLSSVGRVTIASCIFTHNRGSAISFHTINSCSITVTETIFEQNEIHGIRVYSMDTSSTKLVIKDSVFQENNGICLGGYFLPNNNMCFKQMDIIIKNVTFFNNTNQGPLYNNGIVQVDKTVKLSIEDSCVFRANNGSSIIAQSTTVTLSGMIMFEDNVALYGGAIYLSNSVLNLNSVNNMNTTVLFVNNTAKIAGGGIYIDPSLDIELITGSSCFYKIGVSHEKFLDFAVNLTLVFINNTATNGGNNIYGATPNSPDCLDFYSESLGNLSVYSRIFKISSNLSSISSDPKRVCLCDASSQLMCANLSHIFYNTTRYPGEVFSLPLAVVGFEFGTVPGPVYADLLPHANKQSMSSLEKDQYARQFNTNGCAQFNFTVNTLNKNETIILRTFTNQNLKQSIFNISSALDDYIHEQTHTIDYTLLTVPVFIGVKLLDCPPGFQFSEGRCDCASALKDIGINDCTIYNNTTLITRSRNQWIQVTHKQDGILCSGHCPFNYCKSKNIHLNLSNPDEQCTLNHTGILCGACPSNLSLAIGSSRCLKCSGNYYTLTLIAFGAAGLLLVLFIKILDVTVTTGTVNGLIFYANIIWTNQTLLFPPPTQTSSLLEFLKVFIAWLNLDLGIETCFIQHLDGYWKTWLQFVFPAYIWLIAGLIILVSHYSIKATHIFGNNSVSVLATLFLLSYAKLLRTILTVLEFTLLETPHGQIGVWSFDGNIPYFSLKHSILFVVAIFLLLVLWLPYTFALLFIKYVRKYSHCFLLRRVNKLNPLFDSYLGPLKPKHYYWIGVGLLARLVLLLSSTVTLTTAPYIAVIMIIIIAFALVSLVSSVHKQKQLCLIEGCYLFNMAAFSSGTLFIEAQTDRQQKDALACTSLGIAFLLFLAIIVYHVWRRLKSLIRHCINARNGYANIQTPAQDLPPRRSVTYQEVPAPVPKLRESLLESFIK